MNKATKFTSLLSVDHHTTTYLLQVEGMECGQHTTQSQQPVSKEYTEDICTSLCFRTTLILNAAPLEREGFSETDSTQYCNSKKHLNQEEAQLLATPPMYQIQQIGSIKDYSRNTNIKHKLKTSKREASRRIE